MRFGGSGALPRLRARRSSAAHAWSWIRTVTPLTFARPACTSARSSRWWTFVIALRFSWPDLCGSPRGVAISLRPPSGDRTLLDAPELEPARHRGDLQLPEHVLAAGHRDGVVLEDLVGDVRARGSGEADRQRRGVVERAVADVLDEVVGLRERLHADELRALAAHLRD